jgi:hypothetical protein
MSTGWSLLEACWTPAEKTLGKDRKELSRETKIKATLPILPTEKPPEEIGDVGNRAF